MWDLRLCTHRRGGHTFDLMEESSERQGVLATALLAWVGFELPDDEAMAHRTVEHAMDLHLRGASIEETCESARSFSTRWARTALIPRGA